MMGMAMGISSVSAASGWRDSAQQVSAGWKDSPVVAGVIERAPDGGGWTPPQPRPDDPWGPLPIKPPDSSAQHPGDGMWQIRYMMDEQGQWQPVYVWATETII